MGAWFNLLTGISQMAIPPKRSGEGVPTQKISTCRQRVNRGGRSARRLTDRVSRVSDQSLGDPIRERLKTCRERLKTWARIAWGAVPLAQAQAREGCIQGRDADRLAQID